MLCKCGFENAEDAKFCLACGTPLAGTQNTAARRCQCGLENAADAKFCLACGAPLANIQTTLPTTKRVVEPSPLPMPKPRRVGIATVIGLILIGVLAAGGYWWMGPNGSRNQKNGRERSGLFLIRQGNKVGYIDKTGKIVINPQFDSGGNFSEGLAHVIIGEKVGYIDKTGKFVLNIPKAIACDSFSDGLAAVWVDGKYGYIDKTGKFIINPQFDLGTEFYDGLARVRLANKWGYIDKTGMYAINPQFDGSEGFSEGLARVFIGGKWGYVDKTGKFAINPQFDGGGGFSEGLASVLIGGKWGYVDKTGKFAINPQFDGGEGFSEGLAVAVVGSGQCGYIDKTGKFVINLQFGIVESFSEGLAVVKIGDKWGYIDKTGKLVINPQFDSTGTFSEGLAQVWVGGKTAYIDKTGKYVWMETIEKHEEATTLSPPPPPPSESAAGSGQSLSVDGVSSFVTLPSSPILNSFREITIELWIKPTSFDLGSWNNMEGLVSKGEGANSFYIWITRNSDNQIPGNARSFSKFKCDFGFDSAGTASTSWHTPGSWYHIAATYDGKTVSVYVNGIQEGMARTNGPITVTSSQSIFINHHTWNNANSSSERIGGLIDEFRLWNRALSNEDIKLSMNRELSGNEAGLLVYYNFNKLTEDGQVKDLSPNALHGKTTGGAHLVAGDDTIFIKSTTLLSPGKGESPDGE